MRGLIWTLRFKITATVLFWCLPLIVLPAAWLHAAGLPEQPSMLFLRLLGWAYLALCVGYSFALQAALRGEIALGPIWVGLVSNAGACVILLGYGVQGAWTSWGPLIQFLGWSSVLATALITAGLGYFGVYAPQRMHAHV